MKTSIDDAGRLVVPKAIRTAAGLLPGIPLEVRVRDGRVEIEPAPTAVTLRRQGRLVVATPEGRVPTLRAEHVQETLDALRGGHEPP